MPEAPIDENGNPRLGEDDIRPEDSMPIHAHRIVHPEAQPQTVELRAETTLSRGVTTAISLHDRSGAATRRSRRITDDVKQLSQASRGHARSSASPSVSAQSDSIR
jgi:hypothetical protein